MFFSALEAILYHVLVQFQTKLYQSIIKALFYMRVKFGMILSIRFCPFSYSNQKDKTNMSTSKNGVMVAPVVSTWTTRLNDARLSLADKIKGNKEKLTILEVEAKKLFGDGITPEVLKSMVAFGGGVKIEKRLKKQGETKAKLASISLKDFASLSIGETSLSLATAQVKVDDLTAELETMEGQAILEGIMVIPSGEYKALNYSDKKKVALVFKKNSLSLSDYSKSSGTWTDGKFTLVKQVPVIAKLQA